MIIVIPADYQKSPCGLCYQRPIAYVDGARRAGINRYVPPLQCKAGRTSSRGLEVVDFLAHAATSLFS